MLGTLGVSAPPRRAPVIHQLPPLRDIEKLSQVRQSYFSCMRPEVSLILVLLVVEAGATVVLVEIPQPPEGEPPGVDC